MDGDDISTSPESQHERGLSPYEQRAEREEESREQPVTKYDLLAEETAEETEELAKRIEQPLVPHDDED